MAVLGATAMALALATPVQADPPAGVTPAVGDLVGVGSDTTQDVMNHLTRGRDLNNDGDILDTDECGYNTNADGDLICNEAGDVPAVKVYSFDATPQPSTIIPAAGCTPIARPNGSGAGITTVRNDATGCTDFARSSRPLTASETGLTQRSLAKDAVSWAVAPGSHAPATLTSAQLKGIYECTITNWSTVGGIPGTIVPILPNVASGTRSFFLGAIGAPAIGTCVINGVDGDGSGRVIQENDARELTDALKSGQSAIEAIIPYSVAKYVFQGKASSGQTAERASSRIGNVDCNTPIDASGAVDPANFNAATEDPVNGTGATEALNANFCIAQTTTVNKYGRTVFNDFKNIGAPGVSGFLAFRTSTAGDRIVTLGGFALVP
ncbi:MAG: substrate-binding domain-containing protein [Pseudonocardia sp.]|nr:substrate-binding domain-containing protein [Pseudonocardia sp.]